MQFTGAVVILAAAFPHAKVRRTIRSLDVKHQVLNKVDFVRRKDYLQHKQHYKMHSQSQTQIRLDYVLYVAYDNNNMVRLTAGLDIPPDRLPMTFSTNHLTAAKTWSA